MKPMLAATLKNAGAIHYPVIVSPKLDGIRTLIHPELGPVTRSLKPIPNDVMRNALSHPSLKYLDGELVVGNIETPENFNLTQSYVMSKSTTPPSFTYIVFDSFKHPNQAYTQRYAQDVQEALGEAAKAGITVVRGIPNTLIDKYAELDDYELAALVKGYEGVMLRSPLGVYKFGRSTEREQILVKMKQFADAEAEIVGIEYLQHNLNTATTNALGRTERSSHKSGKDEDRDQVGALIVKGVNGPFENVEFKIGTGFTEADRRSLAAQADELPGQIVNYVYQDEGSKDAPRFPRFRGFRDPDDM